MQGWRNYLSFFEVTNVKEQGGQDLSMGMLDQLSNEQKEKLTELQDELAYKYGSVKDAMEFIVDVNAADTSTVSNNSEGSIVDVLQGVLKNEPPKDAKKKGGKKRSKLSIGDKIVNSIRTELKTGAFKMEDYGMDPAEFTDMAKRMTTIFPKGAKGRAKKKFSSAIKKSKSKAPKTPKP